MDPNSPITIAPQKKRPIAAKESKSIKKDKALTGGERETGLTRGKKTLDRLGSLRTRGEARKVVILLGTGGVRRGGGVFIGSGGER